MADGRPSAAEAALRYHILWNSALSRAANIPRSDVSPLVSKLRKSQHVASRPVNTDALIAEELIKAERGEENVLSVVDAMLSHMGSDLTYKSAHADKIKPCLDAVTKHVAQYPAALFAHPALANLRAETQPAVDQTRINALVWRPEFAGDPLAFKQCIAQQIAADRELPRGLRASSLAEAAGRLTELPNQSRVDEEATSLVAETMFDIYIEQGKFRFFWPEWLSSYCVSHDRIQLITQQEYLEELVDFAESAFPGQSRPPIDPWARISEHLSWGHGQSFLLNAFNSLSYDGPHLHIFASEEQKQAVFFACDTLKRYCAVTPAATYALAANGYGNVAQMLGISVLTLAEPDTAPERTSLNAAFMATPDISAAAAVSANNYNVADQPEMD